VSSPEPSYFAELDQKLKETLASHPKPVQATVLLASSLDIDVDAARVVLKDASNVSGLELRT
jgi:hypothetical protein